MNKYSWYKPGDWNAICDRCGFQFKASELIEDWQGFRVCVHDYEERHPQDFLRTRAEQISVPWTRLDPAIVSRDINDNTVLGMHELGSNTGGL